MGRKSILFTFYLMSFWCFGANAGNLKLTSTKEISHYIFKYNRIAGAANALGNSKGEVVKVVEITCSSKSAKSGACPDCVDASWRIKVKVGGTIETVEVNNDWISPDPCLKQSSKAGWTEQVSSGGTFRVKFP
jgi:hypothetical protein